MKDITKERASELYDMCPDDIIRSPEFYDFLKSLNLDRNREKKGYPAITARGSRILIGVRITEISRFKLKLFSKLHDI